VRGSGLGPALGAALDVVVPLVGVAVLVGVPASPAGVSPVVALVTATVAMAAATAVTTKVRRRPTSAFPPCLWALAVAPARPVSRKYLRVALATVPALVVAVSPVVRPLPVVAVVSVVRSAVASVPVGRRGLAVGSVRWGLDPLRVLEPPGVLERMGRAVLGPAGVVPGLLVVVAPVAWALVAGMARVVRTRSTSGPRTWSSPIRMRRSGLTS
jgi:hypothetical protein